MEQDRLESDVRELEEGGGFVDRSSFRKIAVRGADAPTWLNDLVTAGVEGLEPGGARRSLLLTPKGRIRADFQVLRLADEFLLIQDPSQPGRIHDLLAPYVLSSDVELVEQTADWALFCLPGSHEAPDGLAAWRPSSLGSGVDVVTTASAGAEARSSLRRSLGEVGEPAVDAWRIRHGLARFPVDVDEDSLPAEAGLEALVDFTKGCFLGQESIAKVRNLGHPPRVVLALTAGGPAAAGEAVLGEGLAVGLITSASQTHAGTSVIARVSWEARSVGLATARGVGLRPA
ncbi:MAG: CAF17-like 4Fe-4S cluster assembly/insertion protein YgfZ [Actinomycetota bacterium]